jgi:hypothetical protein
LSRIDGSAAVGDLDAVTGVVVLGLGIDIAVDGFGFVGVLRSGETSGSPLCVLPTGLDDRDPAIGEVARRVVAVGREELSGIGIGPDSRLAGVSGLARDEEVAPAEVGTSGGLVVDRPFEDRVVDIERTVRLRRISSTGEAVEAGRHRIRRRHRFRRTGEPEAEQPQSRDPGRGACEDLAPAGGCVSVHRGSSSVLVRLDGP